MDRSEKGRLGEDAVCELLERRGHRIVERNYRRRSGEIDIISAIDGFIVFTEVKTRKFGGMMSGIEAVDIRKQKKIILTSDAYLTEHDIALQPRYDVAEVTITRGELPRVVRIDISEGAFTADGVYTVN
ncbi:MAG: YraN family protein [Oscillospiraceae bacterium]